MQTARVLIILCSLALVCLGTLPASADDPNDLYLGVRHERLFSALNLTLVEESLYLEELTERYVVLYTLSHPNALGVRKVCIGVYASTDEAERAIYRLNLASVGPLMSTREWKAGEYSKGVPPALTASDLELGDEAACWKSSALFRRRNVVVKVNMGPRECSLEQMLAAARAIDALLRDDRQIAPLGRFAETPEIVSVGAPERIVRGTPVRLSPVFRGLGPLENLRIRVRGEYVGNAVTLDGKSVPNKVVRDAQGFGRQVKRTPEEDGRFEISTSPEAPLGPDRLIMVVATPDNVIVGKVFTITLTAE